MQAAYVSPLKYKDYDCGQIAMEMDHIGYETTKLYTSLKKSVSDDAACWLSTVLACAMLEGGDDPEAA